MMNLLIPKHPTKATNQLSESIHLSDHLIDKVLSVTVITTLNEVIRFDSHTTGRTTQLEWPQEVGSLLEVFSYCENLVNQIFNADDSARSQNLLDHLVVGDRDPLVVHLESGERNMNKQPWVKLKLGLLVCCFSGPATADPISIGSTTRSNNSIRRQFGQRHT